MVVVVVFVVVVVIEVEKQWYPMLATPPFRYPCLYPGKWIWPLLLGAHWILHYTTSVHLKFDDIDGYIINLEF